MNKLFETPILLITFNRPNHTRQVWDAIKKQRPKYIYVFQDGARESNETVKEKCAAVRAIFDEPLDWDCELKTYYSEVNMGCGPGPAAAITWFFENVEQGIIFEDDCLPADSLFKFYEELLIEYKNTPKISLITANNLKLKWKSNNKSYIFSTVGAATMGSWASWSRAWRFFDYNLNEWEKSDIKVKIKSKLKHNEYFNYYSKIFDLHCNSTQNNAWDYQWFFARTLNETISIVSTVNQISNIGFGVESTHTPNPDDRIANLPITNIKLPLKHSAIKIDKLYDWVIFSRFYNPKKKSLIKKIALKLIELLYCR